MNEVNVDFKVELIGPKSESFMKHFFLLGFPFFLLLVSFLSLLPIFGSCFFNITRNLMILPHWLVDTMDNVWIWREYETLPQVVDPKVQVPWLSLQRWDTKFLNKLISKGLVCGALPPMKKLSLKIRQFSMCTHRPDWPDSWNSSITVDLPSLVILRKKTVFKSGSKRFDCLS